MQATHALLIYAKQSRTVRRLILPLNPHPETGELITEEQITNPRAHLQPGEDCCYVSFERLAEMRAGQQPVEMLLAEHLEVPVDMVRPIRVAVVNPAGEVVHIQIADPALDQVDGHLLVPSTTAQIGDRHDRERNVFVPKITPVIAP